MAHDSTSSAADARTTDPALVGLEPSSMWRVFGDLARIPRESGNEAGVRAYAQDFANKRGFACEVNEVGDVLLRVNPDAPGPVVGLQAHMDMVCVSRDGAPYDFAHEPIHLVREGDFIRAKTTSLGADNGIGVAYALALAEEVSGPLEVLLTVDEEKGFEGIEGVAPGWLREKYMIHIASEEEGYFPIESAGESDFSVRLQAERAPAPAGLAALEVSVDGLKGGHSGVEIHRGRTNALKVLGHVFSAAKALGGVVFGLTGGTAPNVIPSASKGVVGLPASQLDRFRSELSALQRKLATQEDPGLKLDAAPTTASGLPLTSRASDRLVALLDQLPGGVIVASQLDPTQPFVSNNLAMARETQDGRIELTLMSRSPSSAELEKLETTYRGITEGNWATVEGGRVVPGWAPNYDSPLLALFQRKYREQYGKEGKVFEIHAGLECGALQSKYPGMDLISVGPDITGVHSPDEKVSIESARRTYHLVREVIRELHASKQ